jgi:predicted nucleotidyltransferase component of viral defense system
MLNSYDLSTVASVTDAIREIIQEITLLGLSRSAFFKKAAFYGGTALRIFYGLDRYSEDMDKRANRRA